MNAPRIPRKTTLIEQSDGRWLWAQYGTTFKTLGAAIRADDADARHLANSRNGIVVTTREILANTDAGHKVARAITGTPQ